MNEHPRIRVLVNALRSVRFGLTTAYTHRHAWLHCGRYFCSRLAMGQLIP